MTRAELRDFLEAKVETYEHPRFLESDPIQVPHRFQRKEDIEISAFLTATIAWGNRKSIMANALKMMRLLDDAPFDFVMGHNENDLGSLDPFVHRTFNGVDLVFFVKGLRHLYERHDGFEAVFARNARKDGLQPAISAFKEIFFEVPHPKRTTKHLSDPAKGSAAKRLNRCLRWMVRPGHRGVAFGLWPSLSPAQLSCPLDVHSGNVARKLKLLKRRQNDAKALSELDANLRRLDPEDPVKYDFALFGLGVFEKF